jgi:hypothetical protein
VCNTQNYLVPGPCPSPWILNTRQWFWLGISFWGTQQGRYLLPVSRGRKQNQFPKRCFFLFRNSERWPKVQKLGNSEIEIWFARKLRILKPGNACYHSDRNFSFLSSSEQNIKNVYNTASVSTWVWNLVSDIKVGTYWEGLRTGYWGECLDRKRMNWPQVMSGSLVKVCRRFGGTYCFHLHSRNVSQISSYRWSAFLFLIPPKRWGQNVLLKCRWASSVCAVSPARIFCLVTAEGGGGVKNEVQPAPTWV